MKKKSRIPLSHSTLKKKNNETRKIRRKRWFWKSRKGCDYGFTSLIWIVITAVLAATTPLMEKLYLYARISYSMYKRTNIYIYVTHLI